MSKKTETNQHYSTNTNDFQESVNQSFDETKDNIKKSIDESRKQIPKINGSVNNYQEQSLQTAKEILRRSHIRSIEKPSSQASTLTYWWCSASLDYFTDYTPAMMNITRADIQQYLKKYIVGKPYVAGMIINEEMNKQLKPAEYFKANLKSF